MTPPTSSGFGTTMRTSRKSYSRKTLTHVSPGSMISSSTSDSDNSLHSLYFTSYHGLINYPQKIPATGGSATGTATLIPCVLTVTTSTYAPGGGPQVADVIAFTNNAGTSACISDSNNNTLTVATPAVSVTGSLQ